MSKFVLAIYLKKIVSNNNNIFSDGQKTPLKTHCLQLGLTGMFAINTIDNLLMVHHKTEKTTLVFDICADSVKEAGINIHKYVRPKKIDLDLSFNCQYTCSS